MRRATWARWWFLAFAAVLAGELTLGRPLMPFAATLTMAALLAWALAGSILEHGLPGRLTAAGLSLLTAAVVVTDAPPGSVDDVRPGGAHALVAALLFGLGVSVLAASVLARVTGWRATRFLIGMLPAAAFALGVVWLTTMLTVEAPGEPDLLDRVTVLLFPAAAIILAGLAINAGVSRRGPLRVAAVALLPLLVAASVALLVVADNDLVGDRTPEAMDAYWPAGNVWTWEEWERAERLAEIEAARRGAGVPANAGIGSTVTINVQASTAYSATLVTTSEPDTLPAFPAVLLLLGLVTLVTGFPPRPDRTGTPLY
ncbi:hypothetical protein [Actinoplanes sp. GCM10030250]|uniref:hypothetical protein n=1 Tax=Actinoplanes sp. GCM10030250 TaxID=3273376 RepID=UPI00360C0A4F